MKKILAMGLILLLGAVIPACAQTKCGVKGTGMITYLEMEGGFFGIKTDSGAHYRPLDLSEKYRRHGLRIRFCLNPVQGSMGFHMWGTPVEVISVEPLAPVPDKIPEPAAGKTGEGTDEKK